MRILVLMLFCLPAFAQKQPLKITYEASFNDKVGSQSIVYSDSKHTLISSERTDGKKIKYPSEQIIFTNGKLEYISALDSTHSISANDNLTYTYEFTDETKEILGYKCRKAKTVVSSNTIEIWYTKDVPNYAGPSTIGIDLGLVLETIRNGNTKMKAIKVEEIDAFPHISDAEKYDLLTYRDLIWKSRFTTIRVFENELINWNEETKAKEGVLRFANGTLILTERKVS